MTTYRSPWRHRWYVWGVSVVRRLIRPWPRIEQRFIEGIVHRQNRRVERHLAVRSVRTILLILPRCVKPRACGCEVRQSLSACRECDECQLGPMARLCTSLGVRALVAFRSHHAFAIARRERPDLIVASACHDRLIKALRSVPEIPALLCPLTSMERMCVGARFDGIWLAQRLRSVSPAGSLQAHAEKVG